MSPEQDLYAALGCVLFGLGLLGLTTAGDALRRILAINVIGAGVFLVLVAAGGPLQPPDPVPRAMVITGIVVAVAATALALNLALKAASDSEVPPDRSQGGRGDP